MPSLFVPDDLVKAPTKVFTFTGAAGLGAIGQTNPIWTPSGVVQVASGISVYVRTSLTENPVPGGATLSIGTAARVGQIVPVGAALSYTIGLMVDGGGGKYADGSDMAWFIGGRPSNLAAPITMNVLVSQITGGVIEFNCWYRAITAGASLA